MTHTHYNCAGEALTVATAGVTTSFRILIRDEYGNARAQVRCASRAHVCLCVRLPLHSSAQVSDADKGGADKIQRALQGGHELVARLWSAECETVHTCQPLGPQVGSSYASSGPVVPGTYSVLARARTRACARAHTHERVLSRSLARSRSLSCVRPVPSPHIPPYPFLSLSLSLPVSLARALTLVSNHTHAHGRRRKPFIRPATSGPKPDAHVRLQHVLGASRPASQRAARVVCRQR